MPELKVPTKAEFKSLTGRSGFGRVFKTKTDLDPIFAALVRHDLVAQANDARTLAALRGIRKECCSWLVATFGTTRASTGAVSQLKDVSNRRFLLLTGYMYAGQQANSNAPALPIKPVPNLPFGRELTGKDAKRVGNTLDAHYAGERGNRHWGPSVDGKMRQWYTSYQNSGGNLSLGAWADHILPANMEDDPGGMFLGGPNAMSAPSAAERQDGVKYCTAQERASYALKIQSGIVQDKDGTIFDTSSRETAFSGFGWAIFVLGFDNILYSNTHRVNLFHHSSFFGGNPVQCGGEICCIAGKVRYLTPKTGHYKSNKQNFYRFLSFLHYHGVDMDNALACPEPRNNPMKFWLASEVFNANGGEPTSPPTKTGAPAKLNQAGVPSWPMPPMQP